MMHLLENPTIIWFLIGLVLLVAELVFPGLILIFFGVGAWITGLAVLIFDLSFTGQMIVFILSSISNLLFLRKSLQQRWWQKRLPTNEMADEFLGRTCSVTVPILPGPNGGKVYFKGTTWKALAHVTIPAGDTVRIIGKESIVLLVEPLD